MILIINKDFFKEQTYILKRSKDHKSIFAIQLKYLKKIKIINTYYISKFNLIRMSRLDLDSNFPNNYFVSINI